MNRYGYLDEMANGGTLICGVRKLDDIDTPFITCEVRLSNDGTAVGVAQFYRAFNERPSAPEESEFLREFAEFIHNHNYNKGRIARPLSFVYWKIVIDNMAQR